MAFNFKDMAKEMGKDMLKNMTKIGSVSGSSFPINTKINLTTSDGESALLLTYPNREEYIITHDKVKYAEVLAMGVIDIQTQKNVTTSIYGTKYKVELNDGKVAILTVGLGDTLYQIEHIIF